MQPDYNHLWNNLSKYNYVDDTHFYAFFEDSLNQFISTNSDNSEFVENKIIGAPIESLNEITKKDCLPDNQSGNKN